MTVEPFLDFSCREQLREWLTANHASESHAWVACNRSKTPRPDSIPYVEIVEECLTAVSPRGFRPAAKAAIGRSSTSSAAQNWSISA